MKAVWFQKREREREREINNVLIFTFIKIIATLSKHTTKPAMYLIKLIV